MSRASRRAESTREITFGAPSQLPAERTEEPKVDPSASAIVNRATMQTGPSGLLLGFSARRSPVTVRIFRAEPTRVFVSTRPYVQWILIFRCVLVGAHVTILTERPDSWTTLRNVVNQAGGTIEIVRPDARIPGQGRPYRPSLIVDDTADQAGMRTTLGAWQALMILGDLAPSSAVHTIRSCDLTIASSVDARGQENLRRGYVLSQQHLRLTNNLSESEVVVALPRRLSRVSMPPTPIEYDVLFAG